MSNKSMDNDGIYFAMAVPFVAMSLGEAMRLGRGSALKTASSGRWKRVKGFNGAISYSTTIQASYEDLVRALGNPVITKDPRSVFAWDFVSPGGKLFSIYDYKATKRYTSEGYTLKELKALPSFEWHVGTESDQELADFKQFVYEKIEEAKQAKKGSLCCGREACRSKGRGSFS